MSFLKLPRRECMELVGGRVALHILKVTIGVDLRTFSES